MEAADAGVRPSGSFSACACGSQTTKSSAIRSASACGRLGLSRRRSPVRIRLGVPHRPNRLDGLFRLTSRLLGGLALTAQNDADAHEAALARRRLAPGLGESGPRDLTQTGRGTNACGVRRHTTGRRRRQPRRNASRSGFQRRRSRPRYQTTGRNVRGPGRTIPPSVGRDQTRPRRSWLRRYGDRRRTLNETAHRAQRACVASPAVLVIGRGRVRHAWAATTSASAASIEPRSSKVASRPSGRARKPARTAGMERAA